MEGREGPLRAAKSAAFQLRGSSRSSKQNEGRMTSRAGGPGARSSHGADAKKVGEHQAIGRPRANLNTEIHVLVDAPGNPSRIVLTAGQVHDLAEADAIAPGTETEALPADKRVGETLQAAGKIAAIPPKRTGRPPETVWPRSTWSPHSVGSIHHMS